ncbi:uncharacterized protein LOC143462276 [Clavelina lepadiformis]|uniref:uncharacterized protein LOC143462276 n=1 Tax=Clavelina lepadiformis TaxID=159417 RepID=UPI0040437A9E
MENDPQQVYIETTTPPVKGIKHKSVIFGLGVTEVVLGLISVTLGVILCTEGDNLRIHRGIRTPVLGEGIWCGIWFIVAGSLGIAAGCKPSGVRVMNAHLGFSIWGSVMALVLTNVGLYYVLNVQQHGRKSYYNTYKVVSTPTGGEIQDFAAIITIGVVAFILQIVSAVCCCCATPYNCCACPCNEFFDEDDPATQTVRTEQILAPQGDPADVYLSQHPPQADHPTQFASRSFAPL